MEAIAWAFKPTIQSVHPQEPQVMAWRESIAATLTAALHPARQYIAKVQAYCSWLVVDPVAYVEALQVSKSLLLQLVHLSFQQITEFEGCGAGHSSMNTSVVNQGSFACSWNILAMMDALRLQVACVKSGELFCDSSTHGLHSQESNC